MTDDTMLYMRTKVNKDNLSRKFENKKDTHPTVGDTCAACGDPLAEGDDTCLVPIGPGKDVGAREAAREGRYYNALCVEVHWACATGEKPVRNSKTGV